MILKLSQTCLNDKKDYATLCFQKNVQLSKMFEKFHMISVRDVRSKRYRKPTNFRNKFCKINDKLGLKTIETRMERAETGKERMKARFAGRQNLKFASTLFFQRSADSFAYREHSGRRVSFRQEKRRKAIPCRRELKIDKLKIVRVDVQNTLNEKQ